jgi:hypothetical protein
MRIGTLLLQNGGRVFIFRRACKGKICISAAYLYFRIISNTILVSLVMEKQRIVWQHCIFNFYATSR